MKSANQFGQIEFLLKDLWGQYIKCLESKDQKDRALQLRREYFKIYRQYKLSKEIHQQV